jgi:hypothetical protein
MSRCLGVLSLAAVLITGCSQYRTVPVSEASKFSSDRFPAQGGVIVHDVDGNRVRIEHFMHVAIEGDTCVHLADAKHPEEKPCWHNGARFATPLGIRTEGTTVFIKPNDRRRNSQTVKIEGVREVTLVDKSQTRGSIVIPIAIVVGILGFYGGAALGEELEGKEDGTGAVLVGIGGAVAAAGASLLVTLPLTADLGETLDPEPTLASDTNRAPPL